MEIFSSARSNSLAFELSFGLTEPNVCIFWPKCWYLEKIAPRLETPESEGGISPDFIV